MKVTLKINTRETNNIVVELQKNSRTIFRITESQKIGSQVLLPMIDKAIKKAKIKITDIGSIEVNPGPGSFTGTRVGVTVANALGFALDIPVNGKKGKIVLPVYDKSKFDY